MNSFDDDWSEDGLDMGTGGAGLARYPVLRSLIWFFRGAAVVIAIGGCLVSFKMLDDGVGFFLSTLGVAFSIAGGQLFLAEVVSVFVDIAESTRTSSDRLGHVQRDVDWLRERLAQLTDQDDVAA